MTKKNNIIKSAFKLFQNDIALVNLDSSMYTFVNDMADINRQLSVIPVSLKLLLKPLVKLIKLLVLGVDLHR